MTPTFGKATEIKSSLCYAAYCFKNNKWCYYYNGLTPTTQLKENLGNLGT
jgi:hypothetical protein